MSPFAGRDHTEDALLANSPWRGDGRMMINRDRPRDNAIRQSRARKRKSFIEQETGLTPEQLEAFHAAQRARVFQRFAPTMSVAPSPRDAAHAPAALSPEPGERRGRQPKARS